MFSVDEEDDEDFSSDDDDEDDGDEGDDGDGEEMAALPNVAARARTVMNRAVSQARAKAPRPAGGHERGPGRPLRIRPMPPTMRDKYPKTRSILFTNDDGKQVMLVRK